MICVTEWLCTDEQPAEEATEVEVVPEGNIDQNDAAVDPDPDL